MKVQKSSNSDLKIKRSRIWTTKLVNEVQKMIELGEIVENPFIGNDYHWKQPDLTFEYTDEELDELKKCAADAVYFANKYAFSMTDEGIQKITLRDYQVEALKDLQENRFNIWLASRQIGKCFLHNINITIKNKTTGEIFETTIGELFDNILKKKRKITLIEKIKMFLWKMYSKKYFNFSIILFLIQFIEKIEYKNIAKNQNDPNLKIFETLSMLDSNYEILTDTGFKPIEAIHQTQPFDIWELKTESYNIECADKHIVFGENFKEYFVGDLKIGDYIQTKTGLEKVTFIKKKKYQVSMYDLSILDENHRYYTNGILSHNSVISGIFLTWYFCFHYDRNAMVMANKGATMIEIIDKIKEVYKHLPFFLKPGVYVNNQTTMRFDNGCRLFGQATTKTAAIGFTIHLLFCDEFAHIPISYLEPFYRSVYPTLSSSKISRFIITSTPNGMNKFYEIYTSAIIPKGEKGSNSFNPIRTDYWQVPGRDEEWKNKEIGNLGSEEMFNQEYGLQFIASSKTLLGSEILKRFKNIVVEYIPKDIDEINNSIGEFWFHPDWDEEIHEDDLFVLSIDLGNGGGGDYSVLNLFKLEIIPIELFDSIELVKDETSFFRLNQFALYRNNRISPEELSFLIIDLLDWIGWDKMKIILETNFKGDTILNTLSENKKFDESAILHTKHTEKSKFLLPGIRWNKLNKPDGCQKLKFFMKQYQVHVTEKLTFNEMNSFGQDNKGNYKALGGNDDIMMTLVNLSQFINSEIWLDMIEDIYDTLPIEWRNAVNEKLDKSEVQEDLDDLSYLKDFM